MVLVSVMATATGITVALWDSASGGSNEYGPVVDTIDWNSWTKYFAYDAVMSGNSISYYKVKSFEGTNLGDVVFPTQNNEITVSTINSSVFASTTKKELPITIYISGTISTIEAAAFANLPNLERVVFSVSRVTANGETSNVQSAVTVGAYCFAGCANLKEIVIEGNRSVTFDPTAFIGCTSLEKITGYTSAQIDALNI